MGNWKEIQYKMYVQGERNITIDLLRGVAAIAVIAAHAIQRGAYAVGNGRYSLALV